MCSFIKSRWQSIQYALQGIRYVLRTQQNAWVHAIISIAVIVVGAWLSITPLEWAVILLIMALVWTAELFNTVFEVLMDLINPQPNLAVKNAKDISAAAVLITAFASILIGLLILGPPLWARLWGFF